MDVTHFQTFFAQFEGIDGVDGLDGEDGISHMLMQMGFGQDKDDDTAKPSLLTDT